VGQQIQQQSQWLRFQLQQDMAQSNDFLVCQVRGWQP
jgi:hypothetical protein